MGIGGCDLILCIVMCMWWLLVGGWDGMGCGLCVCVYNVLYINSNVLVTNITHILS